MSLCIIISISIPSVERLKLSHLAFADDLIIFTRGDYPLVAIFHEALKDFGEASGLQANSSNLAFFWPSG